MKPIGLDILAKEDGVQMEVKHPSKLEDAIWEAVKLAIAENITPRQFIIESSIAWQEELEAEKRSVAEQFDRYLK